MHESPRPIPRPARLAIALSMAVALAAVLPAAWADDEGDAPPTASPAEPLIPDASLVTGELASGLAYIIAPSETENDDGATVSLVIRAGTIHESPSPSGIAEIASRLPFHNSSSFAPGELDSRLGELGASLNPRRSVRTFFDSTHYHIDLPERSSESLGLVLRMYADISRGAEGIAVDEQSVAREREAALRDLRAGAGINQRISRALLPRLLEGTPYPAHPPGGTEAGLRDVTAAHVRAFVERAYTPDRMTLLVTGGFDPDRVRRAIEQSFPNDKPPNDRRERAQPAPHPRTPAETIVLRDPELPNAIVNLVRISSESPAERTRLDLIRALAREVALDALKRRIQRHGCGTLPVQRTSAHVAPFSSSAVQISLAIHTEPGAWDASLASLSAEVRAAHGDGFTKRELRDAKRGVLDDLRKRSHKKGTDRQARALAGAAAMGSTPMRPATRLSRARDVLSDLSAESINAIFRTSFDPDRLTTILLLPASEPAPDPADVRSVFERPDPELARAAGAPADARSLRIAPIPTPGGTVDRLEIHPSTGVLSAQLGNGVHVHHLRRESMDGRVVITVTLAGGRIDEDASTRGLTRATAAFWEAPSTEALAACDTKALLDAHAVELRHAIEPDRIRLEIESRVESAETIFRLLAATIASPSLERQAFTAWQSTAANDRAFRETMPRAMLNEVIVDALFPGDDPRHRSLSEKEIRAIDIESVRPWLASLCAASPIEIAVVGDIGKQRTLDLAAEYIGALNDRAPIGTRTSAPERVLQPRDGPVRRHEVIPSSSGRAVALVGFRASAGADTHDRRTLGVAMRILASRLDAELADGRTDVTRIDSGVYANESYPEFGLAYAYAESAPDASAEARRAIEHAFARLAVEPPSQREVDLARREALNELSRRRDDPEWWADRLSTLEYRGLSVGWIDGQRAALEAVSTESILATLRAYHDASRKIDIEIIPRDRGESGTTDETAEDRNK